MSIQAEVRPSRGRAFFVAGGVLVVLAFVGIVVYATGLPDLAPLDGPGIGLVRGLTVVVTAVSGGVGALLIALGGVKRMSAHARGGSRGAR